MIFGAEIARSYDSWLQTPSGRYIDDREKRLILDLTSPKEGERLLDVGCGTGDHLLMFRARGCHVTGIEPSPHMLDMAEQKIGHRQGLHVGKAEDLPFSDNEFDIVILMTSLEFTDDPQQAVAEAVRVCRGRIFIGVLNKLSLIAIQRRLAGRSRDSIYNHARFYTIDGLRRLIRGTLPEASIRWGSVVFMPFGWYPKVAALEESIPVRRNPFGAFLGLSFPVHVSYRTLQDPVLSPFQVQAKRGVSMQGAAKEWKS